MMIRIVLSLLLLSTIPSCKRDPLAKLPEFSILLQDSATIFNTSNIPEGKTIILLRFDAHCKDCQEETDSLLKIMDELKEIRFYFVTTEPFSQVKEFNDFYELSNHNNITVGHDYAKFFPKHFKSHTTPFLAIYNKEKKLVGIYDGKPAMAELIASIKSVN